MDLSARPGYNIRQYLYEPVYVLGPDEDDFVGKIAFAKSFDAITHALSSMAVEVDNLPVLIHGCIAPAFAIPEICKASDTKFLITYKSNMEKGYIREIEAQTAEHLAEEIVDYLGPVDRGFDQAITRSFVLYGHKMRIILSAETEDDYELRSMEKYAEIARTARRLTNKAEV